MTILLRQKPLPQVVRQIVQRDNGAWFDPEDMSTMYQDAAGTTPVTAVEQPVGLMLDKSRGMMLGPELVSNGTFDSGTEGWVSGNGYAATITATGGVCSFTSVNSGARIRPPGITTNIDAMYTVTITILSIATTVIVRPSTDSNQGVSGTSLGDLIINSVGTYTFMFKARTTTTYLWVISNGAIGTVVSLDNISVRELYGNHATQSVTASRPVLSARKNILLATEALATQSVTTLAAQYTLSFTGAGSVTLSGTATGTLTGTGTDRVSLTFTPTAGTLTLTVSGSVTKAQLELGASAGPYQRVNTATDYDTDERYFPKYLMFDGIDDYLTLGDVFDIGSEGVSIATSVILFDATKSPIAGKSRATSEGGRYFLGVELSAFLLASHDIASLVMIGLAATIGVNTLFTAKLGPHGARYLSLYENAALINSIGTPLTTSSYDTNNPFWIGAYPNSSGTTPAYVYLKGGIYGLIITKSALTNSQRIACERYLGRKSGVQL